jgi:hypothetical protein
MELEGTEGLPTGTEGEGTGESSADTGNSGEGVEVKDDEGGEGKESTQQVKEPVDENHPTNLGRKVKAQGEQIESLLSAVRGLTEEIRASRQQTPQKGEVSDRYDEGLYEQMVAVSPPPVDTIVTPKDQYLVKQWEDKTMSVLRDRAETGYGNAYWRTLDDPGLKEKSGDLHAQVVALVTNPKDRGERYNKKQTGNPIADAKLNYLEALGDIRAGKVNQDDMPTFHKGDAKGSGLTKPTGDVKKVVAAPKMSKEAAEFADYLGLSVEDRAEAMTRKIGSAERM